MVLEGQREVVLRESRLRVSGGVECGVIRRETGDAGGLVEEFPELCSVERLDKASEARDDV